MNYLKSRKLILCFCVFVFLCFNVLAANFCMAQETLLKGGASANCNCTKKTQTSEECKQYCGDYELNDFARIAVQASKIILGLVGSLALLMFIYGGVMFLISAGNSEKVTQAKQIIVGAVIGLVIVFASYMVINFVATALGVPGFKLETGWFNK